jgi:hypothetical protein
MSLRNLLKALPVAGLIAVGANTAQAQPIVTGGLVNVTITDALNNVLSNNNVAVGAALTIAANVCGVAVNVLATQLGASGPISCTNPTSGQTVTISQRQ